jgi:hypothetical protein
LLTNKTLPNLFSDLKVLSESLDEDNDGIISLADIEKVLKEYNITDSADAAMFLIEEVNARGIH